MSVFGTEKQNKKTTETREGKGGEGVYKKEKEFSLGLFFKSFKPRYLAKKKKKKKKKEQTISSLQDFKMTIFGIFFFRLTDHVRPLAISAV